MALENLDRWENNGSMGPNHYDWAVDGIPFLSAASKEFSYMRESVDINKQQIDSAKEIGEQALGNWWYRSQSSFDLGANAFYSDTSKDDNISRRFFDSCGVDALEELGQLTLHNTSELKHNLINNNVKALGFAAGGSTGIIYADGTNLYYDTISGSTAVAIDYTGSGSLAMDETILDIETDGSRYFVLTNKAVYSAALPGEAGEKIIDITPTSKETFTNADSGVIKFVKERLIIGIRKGDESILYQTAIVKIGETKFYNPTRIEWAPQTDTLAAGVKYTFAKNNSFVKGGTIAKIEDSTVDEYNFSTPKVISNVSGDGLKVRIASTNPPADLNMVDISKEAKVYSSVANLPIEIYRSIASYWNWSAVSEGPNGIYFAGYSGEKSGIMFSTLRKDTADDAPEVQPPYIVAELPVGEVIYSMVSYLSVYIIIGTNKGVRVGIIDGQGGIIMGPLTLKSDNDVKSLAVSGDFCFAGGATTTELDGTVRVAMYKINLSKPIQENTLSFSYQKFLYADDVEASNSINITSITKINTTNKLVFTVKGSGVYQETSTAVANGWLETGKIRLDTAEDKVFQYLRVSNLPTDGFISVYWRDETNLLSSTPITRWYCDDYNGEPIANTITDPTGIRAIDMEGTIPDINGQINAHPYISYRFVLERGLDNISSPTLLSYQVKANPANIKQSLIRVPLLVMSRERGMSGLIIERPIFDRIRRIEKAEQEGKVVLFQDFGTGEERLVLIERTQFISSHIPENKNASDKAGILLLTLRTIDPINITGSLI